MIELLLALAIAGDSSAEEVARTATQTANEYAACAGTWDYVSEMESQQGRPSSAEHFHNLGNGASTAALWLHAHAHVVSGGKGARYGAFSALVAPRRASSTLRARALAERSDHATLGEQIERCTAMLEAQQLAIDNIRSDTVDQAIKSEN